ncbi:MAG: lipid-A-disaccharide synthase [Opitutaceae bacterium]|nr:lipid-A-disaccharide synthase [Opitutaceae bacterium]
MSDSPQLPFRLPEPTSERVDLLVVAGEHSGDEHAAHAVRGLRAENPESSICALGGPQLEAAGAQLLYDLTASSVVGIVEVLKSYSFFKVLFEEVLDWIEKHRPRAVCFVDYPGLNLRLAKALRERGISIKGGGDVKLLYYISPQIWAWKAKRRFTMARDLDALAVIFPFEVACYADTDLAVEFVGHPFVAPEYQSPVTYDPAGPFLLLPGSRKQAVERIFPVLLSGLSAYGAEDTAVLYPSEAIHEVLEEARPPSYVRLMKTGEPIAARAVLTSSGTMSLHCALAGIPGAIAYRTNALTYLLARLWVKLDYIGIANLLLKEPMYPEYIQGRAKGEALATELRSCAEDQERIAQTGEQQRRLKGLLDQPASGTISKWLARQLT